MMLFTQIIHKNTKNKENNFNLTAQYNNWHTGGQGRRVTDWREERRWDDGRAEQQ